MKPESRWELKHIFIIISIVFGVFLALINSSMVNVALNTIMKYFNINVDVVTWIVTAYALAYAVMLPVYGKLGDIYGHKRLYLVGITVFILGSALCGFSRNFGLLVTARIIQAFGAAGISPMSIAIISHNFPSNTKGKALGLWGAAIGAGAAVGPTLGGFLIELGGWHWIFFVNIPVGIIALISAFYSLPASDITTKKEKFDFPGVILLAASIIMLLFTFTKGSKAGWLNTITLFCLGTFLTSLLLFLKLETSIKNPFINLDMFKDPMFTAPTVVGFIQMFTIVSVNIITPLYLQRVLHFSPAATGTIILTQPLFTMFMAPVAGKLTDLYSPRIPLFLGTSFLFLANFLLSFISTNTHIHYIIIFISILGMGMGFCSSPLAAAVTGSVSQMETASATGVFNMIRFIGAVMGSNFIGILIDKRINHYVLQKHPFPETATYGDLYLLIALFNLLAIIGAHYTRPLRKKESLKSETTFRKDFYR